MRKLRSSAVFLAWMLLAGTTAPLAEAGSASPPRPSSLLGTGCGDGDANGTITAADALVVLGAGVGLRTCKGCVCDANDSGSVTSLDALMVLREAVGLEVSLNCPVCPVARFRIQSETTCLATHIVVPPAALPEGLSAEDCALEGEATTLPCDARIAIDDDGLVIDVRHNDEAPFERCLLNGTLFACEVTPEEADDMVAAANVACPCNCAINCPSFALCNEAMNPGCIPAPEQKTAAGSMLVSTSTQEPQTTSTSSTTPACGTCCNMEELGRIDVLEVPEVFTEVLFRVSGETTTQGCLFCDPDLFEPGFDIFIEHEDEDSALICIVDHAGIAGTGEAGSCEGYGYLQPGATEVLRASGINFEPLAARPTVNLKEP